MVFFKNTCNGSGVGDVMSWSRGWDMITITSTITVTDPGFPRKGAEEPIIWPKFSPKLHKNVRYWTAAWVCVWGWGIGGAPIPVNCQWTKNLICFSKKKKKKKLAVHLNIFLSLSQTYRSHIAEWKLWEVMWMHSDHLTFVSWRRIKTSCVERKRFYEVDCRNCKSIVNVQLSYCSTVTVTFNTKLHSSKVFLWKLFVWRWLFVVGSFQQHLSQQQKFFVRPF